MEGLEVKALRKKLKWTQTELAKDIGVTKTTVSNWENGRARPCPLAQRELNRLASK